MKLSEIGGTAANCLGLPWTCHSAGDGRIFDKTESEPGVTISVASDVPGSDFLHFFRSFRVAAIAPSGESLARLMTKEIAALDGPIIELGPGTGFSRGFCLHAGSPRAT